jgi:hypothetical protein
MYILYLVGAIKEVFVAYLMFKTVLSSPSNTCHQGYCVTDHYVEKVLAILLYPVRRQLACAQL